MFKLLLCLCDIEYNKIVLRFFFDFLLECELYKYGFDCVIQCGYCKGGGFCLMDMGIVLVDVYMVGLGIVVIYVGCIF